MIRKVPGKYFGLVVVSAIGMVSLHGDSIEILPVADTGLMEYEPDFNLGLQTDVPVGTMGALAGVSRSRMLMRFDVGAVLPEGAEIESAVLRLSVTKAPSGPASVFALHRMLRTWKEGVGSGGLPGGSTALAGETSWAERLVGQDGWVESGGRRGEDFAAGPSATELMSAVGVYDMELGLTALQDLRTWLEGPEGNYGWILLSQSEGVPKTARRFGTRESASAAPRLVVTYNAPPVRSKIVDLAVTSAAVVLQFEAEAGVNYTWEGRASLDGGSWGLIQSVPTPDTSGLISVTNDVASGSQQFFRIRADDPSP